MAAREGDAESQAGKAGWALRRADWVDGGELFLLADSRCGSSKTAVGRSAQRDQGRGRGVKANKCRDFLFRDVERGVAAGRPSRRAWVTGIGRGLDVVELEGQRKQHARYVLVRSHSSNSNSNSNSNSSSSSNGRAEEGVQDRCSAGGIGRSVQKG